MSKSGDLQLATDAGLGTVLWVLGNRRVRGTISRMLLPSLHSAPTLWVLARQDRSM